MYQEPTVAIVPPASLRPAPSVWPPAAAALNLTGLGLGYLVLRRRALGGTALLGSAALILIAFSGDGGYLPHIWWPLIAVWLLGTAAHAWAIARPPAAGAPGGTPAGTSAGPSSWVPLAVAVLVFAAEVAGYAFYVAAGHRTYADGVEAAGRGDCATAGAAFHAVTGAYELTFNADEAAAQARGVECDQLLAADALHAAGTDDGAVAAYKTFRADHPASVLVPFANRAEQRAALDHGAALRKAGDRTTAIAVYLDALGEPDADPQLRTELAASYLERAAATQASFGADLPVEVASVTGDLLGVRKELADTPAAQAVGAALTQMMAALRPQLGSADPCTAALVLNELAALPAGSAPEIAATVADQDAGALLNCGLARYKAGDLTVAVSQLNAVEVRYPGSPGVAQARSARIAAEVAQAKGSPAPVVPAPFAGDSTGPVSVTFYNVDPATVSQVLISGRSTHQFEVGACGGCAPDAGNSQCGSAAGKPSFTVHLQPGTYDVVLRHTGGGSGPRQDVDTDTYVTGFVYTSCIYVK